MIANGEKLHYLAVKSIPTLPWGITSKNNGDFHFEQKINWNRM